MTVSQNERSAINIMLTGISVLLWVLLLLNPGNGGAIAHCQVLNVERCWVTAPGQSAASVQVFIHQYPFSVQLTGWGFMVLAMMLPTLIIPVQHICQQSFKRYRVLHSLLFVLAYTMVWMVAGVITIALVNPLYRLMPLSYIPALVVFLIALVWQFSPIKQRCLNRGHHHPTLSAFGWAARRDCLRFGLLHGLWCIGSGWALMLFPMLLPRGHNLAMLLVTLVMISEHLEHPRMPRWQFALRLKLFKLVIAQTRIRLLNSNHVS